MASRTPRRAPPPTLTRSLGLPLVRKNSEPGNWKLPPSPSLAVSHNLSPRFPPTAICGSSNFIRRHLPCTCLDLQLCHILPGT